MKLKILNIIFYAIADSKFLYILYRPLKLRQNSYSLPVSFYRKYQAKENSEFTYKDKVIT